MIYLLTPLSYVAPPTVEPFLVMPTISIVVKSFYELPQKKIEGLSASAASLEAFWLTLLPQSKVCRG